MDHNVVETFKLRKSQDVHSHPYINQYELMTTLGEGMHGKVVLAYDTITNERVAIKVMKRNDPNNRKLPKSNRLGAPALTAQEETEFKIRREIAVMKKCSHQNLVRLREVINDPRSRKVYLVMENLEGGEVKWRTRSGNHPVLMLSQVQRIIRDVTLGLEYLHHQGIIHRDIKPANLLWTQDRQSVKICDFGVSHFTAAAGPQEDPNLYDEAGLTKTAGSPAFFAPEICYSPDDEESSCSSSSSPVLHRDSQTSESPASPSSPHMPQITKQIDIWALGVTLYCLLFGKTPWYGKSEYYIFRAICRDDYVVPETMCRDKVYTGGKDRKPEGQEIGWCVLDLLDGLLEKNQEKRITLADIKRSPWIQTGVQDPEQWLLETAPDGHARVVITDEDTQSAVQTARFSYPGWVSRLTNTIKRVPLPLIPSSRTASKAVAANPTKITISTNLTRKISQPESFGGARSSRTRSIMDRQLKRFAFGSSSPTHSQTLPTSTDNRRNSVETPRQHSQSMSDPSNQIDHRGGPGPSTRCSMPLHTTGSSPRSRGSRQQSDSLQLPGSSASTSPVSSPTTPDDQPVTGNRLRMRISRVIRSGSVKKAVKGAMRSPSIQNDRGPAAPRDRTSAETLDVLRPSEDLGLTPAMRASSWGSPGTPAPGAISGRGSLDMVSEAGADVVKDFNKSVVRVGAGGYVDGVAAYGPPVPLYRSWCTPGASGSQAPAAAAGMSHSDSSSNSTATAATPHQQGESAHALRVMSPLAQEYDSEEDEGLSSDEFGNSATDGLSEDEEQVEDGGEEDDEDSDEDSNYDEDSEDDVIHVRSRRPSAILSRSPNASPLRGLGR